jgi:aminopeptidase N
MVVMLGCTTSPGRGIPETLARGRAAAIHDLRYQISFSIPEAKAQPVEGNVVIRFKLDAPHEIVLDFAQPRDRVRSVRTGDRAIGFRFADGHLILPASATKPGENEIAIEFTAGDEALNRNDEFLYTLFVPARAHLAFPCFDQPDLKARYTLALNVPAGWTAVANGQETAPGRFAETPPLPTYLFAFAAGKFQVETAERNGRTFRMLHRETDAAKAARNRDALFDLHARALAWLEDYTAIPYPWGKFDFVLIPSFQFGGMEHAAAILYNAASLMLDESATQNQQLNRASTIAHETAHMWFGDLVTMRWFNDVWMKEVLANFMAAKIVNPSFPGLNHDLRFLLNYHAVAYEVDRTAGANPIRQELANLNEAGALYGAIIYQKAPVVMRQLEAILGENTFRDGMREYLKRYSFANATWLDLVEILDARTPRDLAQWSQVWVERRARPEIAADLRIGADGRIAALSLTQRDPLNRGLLWPQRLQLALGYANRIERIIVDLNTAATSVDAARGKPAPLYVLPNAAGLGYGLFRLDEMSRRYLLGHIEEIPDALARGSAWVELWENFLEGAVAPNDFLAAATRALPKEPDEQNAQKLLSNVARLFWRFLPQEQRLARAPALERLLREGVARGRTVSQKAAWFAAFRDIALTPESLAWLEGVWRREEKIAGLPLAETDEIELALELAVREIPGWRRILEAQRDRTRNPDRRARFDFVMPALSADPAGRERAFARFRSLEGRRHEPWVLESLRYLHHPLRERHARSLIPAGLDLLREIQATGDIFFPKRWMDATLGGHRSPEAAAMVRDYLSREQQLPERLRWTVLSAADDLFRAAR